MRVHRQPHPVRLRTRSRVPHAPKTDSFFAFAHPLISLQISLAAAEDNFLPPRNRLTLSGFLESTQNFLSQYGLQKRLRAALRDDEFHNIFCDQDSLVTLPKELPFEYG